MNFFQRPNSILRLGEANLNRKKTSEERSKSADPITWAHIIHSRLFFKKIRAKTMIAANSLARIKLKPSYSIFSKALKELKKELP